MSHLQGEGSQGTAIGLHLLLSQELAGRTGPENMLGLQAPASELCLPSRCGTGLLEPGGLYLPAPQAAETTACLGCPTLSPLALFGGHPAWQ